MAVAVCLKVSARLDLMFLWGLIVTGGPLRRSIDITRTGAGSSMLRESVDVLVGGPPCQAFSSIAVAKWESLGMPSTINHPLNKLYREFLRIIVEVKPKFFVIENVEGILLIKDGTVKRIIESTMSAGTISTK